MHNPRPDFFYYIYDLFVSMRNSCGSVGITDIANYNNLLNAELNRFEVGMLLELEQRFKAAMNG